ncbi:MAG: hypothetical protein KBA31_20795 [Alphaproteobacteria bacterium]|nr:hypothetical protein [Alphaproteobacteria bacterium]
MRDATLFRLAGLAALAAGLMRIGSSFLTWDSTVAWQELLATGIDVLLLFGLMGIYFAHRAALGWLGLAAFVAAEAGVGSIIGPDTTVFGVDTYQAGVVAISVGLALLAIVMLIRRAGSAAAAFCWISSLIVGLAGGAFGEPAFGFFLGGILFGLGFVAGGIATIGAATPPNK